MLARFFSVLLIMDSRARFGDSRAKKNALADAIKVVNASKGTVQLAQGWVKDPLALGTITSLLWPLDCASDKPIHTSNTRVVQARGELEGQWEHDQTRTSCLLCQKNFNLFRHRHHW